MYRSEVLWEDVGVWSLWRIRKGRLQDDCICSQQGDFRGSGRWNPVATQACICEIPSFLVCLMLQERQTVNCFSLLQMGRMDAKWVFCKWSGGILWCLIHLTWSCYSPKNSEGAVSRYQSVKGDLGSKTSNVHNISGEGCVFTMGKQSSERTRWRSTFLHLWEMTPQVPECRGSTVQEDWRTPTVPPGSCKAFSAFPVPSRSEWCLGYAWEAQSPWLSVGECGAEAIAAKVITDDVRVGGFNCGICDRLPLVICLLYSINGTEIGISLVTNQMKMWARMTRGILSQGVFTFPLATAGSSSSLQRTHQFLRGWSGSE